jgi:hypothetical protein
MERIGEHEAKTIQGMIETMDRIQTIVAEDIGHAKRGVHAKAHGLLVGELEVLPDLPLVLAQGLFAAPQTYPAVLRLCMIVRVHTKTSRLQRLYSSRQQRRLQYEIKSDKTDHVALHKGAALRRPRRQA